MSPSSSTCDAELDDELVGEALSSPLFTQVGNVPGHGILNRQNCRCAIACVLKTQQFFFDDFDIIGCLPVYIDSNQLPRHTLAIRKRAGNPTQTSDQVDDGLKKGVH